MLVSFLIALPVFIIINVFMDISRGFYTTEEEDDTIDACFTFTRRSYQNDPLLDRLEQAFKKTESLHSKHAFDYETAHLLTHTMRKDLLLLQDLYLQHPHTECFEPLLSLIELKLVAIEEELMNDYLYHLTVLHGTFEKKYGGGVR